MPVVFFSRTKPCGRWQLWHFNRDPLKDIVSLHRLTYIFLLFWNITNVIFRYNWGCFHVSIPLVGCLWLFLSLQSYTLIVGFFVFEWIFTFSLFSFLPLIAFEHLMRSKITRPLDVCVWITDHLLLSAAASLPSRIQIFLLQNTLQEERWRNQYFISQTRIQQRLICRSRTPQD